MARDDATPWVRFFNNDEMLDTLDMNLEERGCYLVLRQRIVRKGGVLPADSHKIAKYLGVPVDKWLQLKPSMQEIFTVTNDGWTHPKWTAEIIRAKARIDQTRRAGQMGGRAKSSNGTRKSPSERYHLELESDLEPESQLYPDLEGESGCSVGDSDYATPNVVAIRDCNADGELISKRDHAKAVLQEFSRHGVPHPSAYEHLTVDQASNIAREYVRTIKRRAFEDRMPSQAAERAVRARKGISKG